MYSPFLDIFIAFVSTRWLTVIHFLRNIIFFGFAWLIRYVIEQSSQTPDCWYKSGFTVYLNTFQLLNLCLSLLYASFAKSVSFHHIIISTMLWLLFIHCHAIQSPNWWWPLLTSDSFIDLFFIYDLVVSAGYPFPFSSQSLDSHGVFRLISIYQW